MVCLSTALRRLVLVLPLAASGPIGTAIADEPASPVVQIAADKIISATYACDSGNIIQVRYDNTNPEAPAATLEYKGKTFEMYQVRSGSGARYATEQGLGPDRGLQWWSKGDGATLSEMLMDHTAPEPTQIETCAVKPAG